MERWKTVSRRDPEFISFLDGSFSSQYRALPVRSLNVGTASEQVTFEIVSCDEIKRPPFMNVIGQLIRPESLSLSVWPMAATLFFCLSRGLAVDLAVAISSFIGVLLFHIAMNLLNDYGDHIKGQDRMRDRGGSRVIQKGWLTATSVRRAAWVLLASAGICGLPGIFFSSARVSPLILIVMLATFVALEFAFQKLRLKYRGWAEIVAFLLTGPVLTCAFAWVITGALSWDEAALGCIFGSMALMYFHSGNFENIMSDSQAGVRTWATRAGFDASKRFFYFTAGLVFISAAAYIAFFEREVLLMPYLIAQAIAMVSLSMRVRRLASPLSSELTGLRWAVVWFGLLTSGVLIGTWIAIIVKGYE